MAASDRLIAAWVVQGRDDDNIVVGPVRRNADGSEPESRYFHVGWKRQRSGYYSAQMKVPADEAREMRNRFIALLLSQGQPLVIHDMDDEMAEARLCLALWPSERLRRLVRMMEAEQDMESDKPMTRQ